MPGVKITRKEIKRDELATTIGSLAEIFEEHRRSLTIAAAALLLLALAVAGGVWFSHRREADSLTALAAVQKAASAQSAEEAASGQSGAAPYATRQQRFQEVLRLADQVLLDHPSSDAARWASYYKAVALKELGSHDDALREVMPLTGSTQDEFVSASARVLQAQIQEAKGDLAGAAEAYGTLAASAPTRFPIDLALINQARLLEAQGRKEEAQEVYRRVSQDFPESPFAGEASRHLQPDRG